MQIFEFKILEKKKKKKLHFMVQNPLKIESLVKCTLFIT